ncbi:hypothetical protein O3M35_006950 [Rhynocoris fuscipes]|uniref:CAF17 C-terminal domain-containing protein n=1 Tax=Rhynocoris fuscipes TaxID=488301 RepID=A0AAW1DHK9_9HEMI
MDSRALWDRGKRRASAEDVPCLGVCASNLAAEFVFKMIIRRILDGRRLTQICSQYFYSQLRLNGNWHLEQLNNRSILKLNGDKCSDFLQGLITNDMKLLESQEAIYAMFLNTKGRVLYDSIIYKNTSDNSFLLECDVNSVESLQKHLNLYKVRKKIDITKADYSVWAIFLPKLGGNDEFKLEFSEKCIVCADPRISDLGYRAIVPKDSDLIANIDNTSMNYKIYRYTIGVAEGNDELLTGKRFPLEMNCDYLNGVSFNKGCYIGQELTARTHHTGVIRKRIMPLIFQSAPGNITTDDIIEECAEKNKTIGKLVSASGTVGLGLMRVKETLTSSAALKLGNSCLKVSKPSWWPESEEYAAKKN